MKIITVHGTNAGSSDSFGTQWWQLESSFQEQLASYFQDSISFDPYHWSGLNSELSRRKAGQELAEKLHKEAEPVILIGHSHGGSVGIHSIFNLLSRHKAVDEKFPVKAFITIGTPSIRYEGANPILRLNVIGQSLILFSLFAIIFFATDVSTRITILSELGDPGYFFSQIFAGNTHVIGHMIFLIPIFLFTIIGIGLFSSTLNSIRRNNAMRRNKLYSQIAERYIALNHPMDEAIASLKSISKEKIELANVTSIRPIFQKPLMLILVGIFSGMAFFSGHMAEFMGDAYVRGHGSLGGVIEQSILVFFVFIAALLSIIVVANFGAFLAAHALATLSVSAVNGTVDKLLKRTVYGNDGYGEKVVQIASGLDFEERANGSLPDHVSKDILDYTRHYALDSLERFRALLTGAGSRETHLKLSEISENLSWKELVHTAYFEVDSFVDTLAHTLAEKTHLTLR